MGLAALIQTLQEMSLDCTFLEVGFNKILQIIDNVWAQWEVRRIRHSVEEKRIVNRSAPVTAVHSPGHMGERCYRVTFYSVGGLQTEGILSALITRVVSRLARDECKET